MDKAIMWIMSAGALIGGADRIFGNRLGLGKKFEEGFLLMGSTALSMAGILCLVPLLSRLLGALGAALLRPLGIDPAMLAGVLAIDMGGYQLAVDLASDPLIGRFSGIVAAAILGCSATFTIPIGMGMLSADAKPDFARGTLFGLISMPAALIIGGLLCGLRPAVILCQSAPLLLLSLLLLFGIWRHTNATIRAFSAFAACIRILTTIGLMLGAVEYMTGFSILPGLAPLSDAMEVVASIAIVMLGSLPMSELLQRALKHPLARLRHATGMNSASAAGLLIGMVSVLPAIALVKDMDRRGRIVNAAFMVCTASCFAAHLGFTAGVDPQMVPALLAAKLGGGALGALLALVATRHMKDGTSEGA